MQIAIAVWIIMPYTKRKQLTFSIPYLTNSARDVNILRQRCHYSLVPGLTFYPWKEAPQIGRLTSLYLTTPYQLQENVPVNCFRIIFIQRIIIYKYFQMKTKLKDGRLSIFLSCYLCVLVIGCWLQWCGSYLVISLFLLVWATKNMEGGFSSLPDVFPHFIADMILGFDINTIYSEL